MIERDGGLFRLSHATGSYLVEGWEESGRSLTTCIAG